MNVVIDRHFSIRKSYENETLSLKLLQSLVSLFQHCLLLGHYLSNWQLLKRIEEII